MIRDSEGWTAVERAIALLTDWVDEARPGGRPPAQVAVRTAGRDRSLAWAWLVQAGHVRAHREGQRGGIVWRLT